MKIPIRRPWSIADSIIFLVLVVVVVWVASETAAQLNYQWNWQLPFGYIVSYGENGWVGGLLLDGLIMSIRLMVIGGVLALFLGAVVATLALSPLRALRFFARLYVEGLRHLPPIVFIFVFFYFISSQLFGEEFWRVLLEYSDNRVGRLLLGDLARAENLLSGALCLAVFEAAFVSEIIRAGILSIESGQWQAARSIGLSSIQTLRFIVLPQALARIAAPLTGQLILLVKDSAILSVISVQELTFSAQETAVSTQQIFETWLLAAGLYFMLCASLLWLCKKLEQNKSN
ncbi:MAG: amino acid ABC transporter permease [Proteobacteria bacterium]|nr:amino acid ABC transporter permease [Pseudomonadota bacterium]